MGKRIGYGKLGRSMPLTLEKCGNLGGDVEMVAVVKTLALRHPEDTFILVGRNTGEEPADVGLPPNVHNPWTRWAPLLREQLNKAGLNHADLSVEEHVKARKIFAELTEATFKSLDAIVMWVGQHGTTNTPIPTIENRSNLTKPYDWCTYYASFILQGINAWRSWDPINREEVWLNADARNIHKMRDLAWPNRHPVLGQFNSSKPLKHERYGRGDLQFDEFQKLIPELKSDSGVWIAPSETMYSRLEINGLLPGTPFGDLISYDLNHNRPGDFGLFINEARKQVSEATKRVNVMRDWVLPLNPHFIHGTWSPESQRQLGREIKPAPWSEYYPRLHSVLTTLTTPSSGSGWATAKPWEAFAAGTVCFFHPMYDTQDNILRHAPAELYNFLRVRSVEELKRRVAQMRENLVDWQHMVRMQREYFDWAINDLMYMKIIERRIYG